MSYRKILLRFLISVQCLLILLSLSCTQSPSESELTQGNGNIRISARIIKSEGDYSGSQENSLSKTAATTWDSLMILVIYSEGDTLKRSLRITPEDQLVTEVISQVPTGEDIMVHVYTLNSSNRTRIHSDSALIPELLKNETENLSFTLYPDMSSISFSLYDLDSEIDSVHAAFESGDTAYQNGTASIAGRAVFSIDYIPSGTSGYITLTAYNGSGDTLHSYTKESLDLLTINSLSDSTIYEMWGDFNGDITVEAEIHSPGEVLVTGLMDNENTLLQDTSEEQCGLYISEIQPQNSYEFIEIYNSGAYIDSAIDTLYLHISSGSLYTLTDIVIDSFYVVSGASAEFSDTVIPGIVTEIVSTGNAMSLYSKDYKLIDRVYFHEDKWPIQSNRSIVLDTLLATGEIYNNYYDNWRRAESVYIETEEETLYGTPGRSGI